MAKRKAEQTQLLNVPAKFGRVSFGKGSSGIPFTIERSKLTLDQADELLCGKRLTARLAAGGGADDDSGQQVLFDDLSYHVNGVFECRKFGVKPGEISGSLNLLLEDHAAVEEIAHLAGHNGQLILTDVAVLEPDAETDAEAEAG